MPVDFEKKIKYNKFKQPKENISSLLSKVNNKNSKLIKKKLILA